MPGRPRGGATLLTPEASAKAAEPESASLLDVLRRALRSESRRILLPLLVYKLFLVSLAPASMLLLPGLFHEANYRDNFHAPPGAPPTLATALSTWDSQHFLYLSQNGYQRLPPERAPFNAFYPLWPATIHVVASLTPLDSLASALLLSNLLSLSALLLFHHLVLEQHGAEAADASLLALLAFPSAFYLCLPYSESLFLFLAVLLFLCIRKVSGGGVVLAGLLAPLTRAPGLLLALPVAAHLLASRSRPRRFLLCLAPPLGYLAYLALMRHLTGDAFTSFKVYGSYAVDRVTDGASLLRALYPTGGLALHGFANSLLDRAVFVLLLAALPLIARLGPAYLVYALAVGVMPALPNAFISYTRYALMAFPLFIALGRFFSEEKRLRWGVACGAVLFALQVVLLLRHANNHWAG